ncbi:flagellar motor protein MotB [Paenarthrobacter sp. DKR-5]|uniref:OmpA/MotB family protein n=1 Tax=Paenarthrobacter sp. DKR-5 TaxID=2835535 RepID=UPI001BDD20AA|nr:flagellar motor protein MotB [Paenarthrobacter sp. DKR-5]MBT1002808.1 flagellar motor protein MotB [Paenarthrobacter sp. DKR-5]
MSARPRRRSRAKLEEHHVDERWMASYMDMVTVLMCMFIVLYAMSTVDQTKYQQLKNSLATGFGAVNVGKIDTAKGVVVPPEQANQDKEGFNDLQLAKKEADKLTALRDKMAKNLSAKGLAGTVQFVIDQRGLTAKLVGSKSYFQPDSPVLTPQTNSILAAISPVIAPIPEQITVEGHAANLITSYPSTWELSSARATAVLRYLVERGGVAGPRIGAIGYGSARLVNQDRTEAEHEENRRVDVVILSGQPDRIRALIPQVLKSGS